MCGRLGLGVLWRLLVTEEEAEAAEVKRKADKQRYYDEVQGVSP